MSDPPPVDCPYVGLVPFTERDARFFFGRGRSTRVIISNLYAAPLTILYGTSGVGKTSVLRAGVVHELLQRVAQREPGAPPELAVAYFRDWSGDAETALAACLRRAAEAAAPEAGPVAPADDLAGTVARCAGRIDGRLLVILDQFEEFFLYHPDTGRDSLARHLARAINASGPGVSFLISLRDDALAKLDRLKSLVPNLFSNYLRLGHLSDDDAREAIRGPLEAYNALSDGEKRHPGSVRIEDGLVDAVVEGVRAGRVRLGGTGEGGAGAEAPEGVETPYLQLVMTRLWERELGSGSRVLRERTLEAMGGPERIVKGHLDDAMARLDEEEQDVASRAFRFLVTPSGSKYALAADDLAGFAEAPETQLEAVLDKLSGTDMRILRAVAPPDEEVEAVRYEIFHDALAPAVLEWRKQWEVRRQLAAQTRRFRRIAGILWVIVMNVIAVSVWYAYTQREAAELDAKVAQSDAVRAAEQVANQRAITLIDQLSKEFKEPGADVQVQQELARRRTLLQQRLEAVDRPPPVGVETAPRVYIHIREPTQRELARRVERRLEAAHLVVPGIERLVGIGPRQNELRFFRAAEQDEAERIRQLVASMGISIQLTDLSGRYEQSTEIRPRHYELWFASSLPGSVWHIDRSGILGDVVFELMPDGGVKAKPVPPALGGRSPDLSKRRWRATERELLIEEVDDAAKPGSVWRIGLEPDEDGRYPFSGNLAGASFAEPIDRARP